MVTLNNIFLGGQARDSSSTKYSGILFWLNSKAKRKKIYQFSNWTIELSQGDFIIARTTDQLSNADLKSQGDIFCQSSFPPLPAAASSPTKTRKTAAKNVDRTKILSTFLY